MCSGVVARVEETGELGRLSRERPCPAPAAARRRRGALGEAFAESVPLWAKGEAGLAVEIIAAGVFLMGPVVEVKERL